MDFFGGIYPENLGNAWSNLTMIISNGWEESTNSILFFSQLPNWSRYPWRASQDSSECFLSHRWLRHSAAGALGAVESMAITFWRRNFMGRCQATKWKRTKHITFFSTWWFWICFLSLPRFLVTWSYLINISQLGWFNHQLVLVVPSFFFQCVWVQKLHKIQSTTSHPNWMIFFQSLGSQGGLEKKGSSLSAKQAFNRMHPGGFWPLSGTCGFTLATYSCPIFSGKKRQTVPVKQLCKFVVGEVFVLVLRSKIWVTALLGGGLRFKNRTASNAHNFEHFVVG